VDLNCGCPIHEATRRGLGSALLRKPEKLARVVRNMAADSPVPLSVKVRTGCEAGSINVRRVAQLLRDAGAAAVTIHGRTAEQRYSKTANWDLIASVVADGVVEGSGMPIVGNGDYEAR